MPLNTVLIIVCSVMGAMAAALGIKLFLIKKSAREISESLEEKLSENTNTPISVSSGDKDIRSLAASLNGQLEILNEKRHIYEQGDSELKRAITNISHDLRTPLTAICGYLDLLERESDSQEISVYKDNKEQDGSHEKAHGGAFRVFSDNGGRKQT